MTTRGIAYGAYGETTATRHAAHTRYAGQISEAGTATYLLGPRPYATTLRRFLAADPDSPFDEGGINRYAYCGGDPIGRSDPGGRSWFGWIASTLSRMEFAVTNARTSAGGDIAFATPTVKAVNDASRAQLIRSGLGRGSDREIIETTQQYAGQHVSIHGPGTYPAEAGTLAGSAFFISWPRKGNTGSVTVFRTDQRTVQVVQGPHAFVDDPVRAAPAAKGRVHPHWVTQVNPNGGVHLASTTPVRPDVIGRLRKHVDSNYPGRHVVMLAGAHGYPHGLNWENGARKSLESSFLKKAVDRTRELDWQVDMLDYADVDVSTMGALLREGEGVYIHLTCFGAADRLFMEAFNVRDIKVRSLYPL